MKREELKTYYKTSCVKDTEVFYFKDEADKVMDAMEERIKELEQRVIHKGCIEYVEQAILNGDERLNNRMAFLLGFTPYEMSVEKFKEEHKLEREQMEERIKELEDENNNNSVVLLKQSDYIKELEDSYKYFKSQNKFHIEQSNELAESCRDKNKLIETLLQRIDELEASQPKWISVEDRLPNDSEPIGTWYIVKFTDGTHYFADWDSDIHIFTNPRCEYTSMVNNIVAWCKQPPKSED